ncbi:MAG: JAB domain-containing protein [Methanobrevibacter sp.]|nr:JAB domain-containing protein [Methanobrevibacter sp.]
MKNRIAIRHPSECISLLQKYTKYKQERFGIIALDSGYNVIAIKVIFIGTSSYCIANPREVFWELCKKQATAFVCFHNHPSGNEEPSADDIKATQEIFEASKIMRIQMLDHIIVTKCRYFSFLKHDENFRIFKNEESAVAERR